MELVGEETLQRRRDSHVQNLQWIVWMFRSTSDFSQHSSQPPRTRKWGSEALRAASELGPGVRLPRLPALYPAKRKWRLPEQSNPLDHLEGDAGGESAWRRNYTSLQEQSDKVVDVLEDQAEAGPSAEVK